MSTAAVAAAAMAALTASQAPGLDVVQPGGDDDDRQSEAPDSNGPGDDSYHTELPPLESPAPDGDPERAEGDASGVPATVLAAYKKAEKSLAGSDAGCSLPWELLAAIGKVESGQARGGAVDKAGTTLKPILGPVLNGAGFARITDTDSGVYDGDATFDRAVGPMQFIPSTWARWGADGNGDGRRDPNNIFDAALAAGEYLCAGERNLSVKADLDRAILSYNHSQDYLRTVLSWLEFYRKGVHEVPDGDGPLPDTDGPGGNSRPGGEPSKNPGTPSKKPGGDKPGGDGGGDKPKDPGGEDPGGDNPGGEDPGGDPGGEDPGGEDPDEPSPAVPNALKHVGDRQQTAIEGTRFAKPFKVRATASGGKPVDDVRVEYAIVGATEATFSGGAKKATVRTDGDGVATAPTLRAGGKTGEFKVRATVVGRSLNAEFTATVKAKPQADTVARTDDKVLTAVAGGAFADAVEVKASYKGQVSADTPMTATMVTETGTPVENGPFFKDADGKPVRALKGLKTNDKGVLRLPEIFAGAKEGTYHLRIATGDGSAHLMVQLNVTKG
ncbi:lytic transglycosylase domain-containing protein [Streptomyces armeniacus]|uniref:lytic transglycosylase domain-containing protein n=1 Tax=Streptomyces armeniacus TaxID=83291 RepID=UPI003CCC885D